MIASYDHSSLFGLIVSNEGKKFYNIDTWSHLFVTMESTKTMFANDVISDYSVSETSLEQVPSVS